MESRLFRLSNYLSPGEHIHAVTKRVDARRPRYRHRHDYCEVMIILDGQVRHDINDTSTALAPGTVTFIRPDDLHLVHAATGTNATILNIMFRPDLLSQLLHRHAEDLDHRFFWSASPLPEIHYLPYASREYVLERVKRLGDGRRTQLRAEALLFYLLSELSEAHDTAVAHLPHWLAKACRAAQEPSVFAEGVSGLVRVAGRSHEHLCRSMKQHIGTSPSAWINNVRMDHAARLLGNSSLPVPEISETCGINNIGHFYKLFRARHGVTPGAFRKRAKNVPI